LKEYQENQEKHVSVFVAHFLSQHDSGRGTSRDSRLYYIPVWVVSQRTLEL